jgi:hypothetical protein
VGDGYMLQEALVDKGAKTICTLDAVCIVLTLVF